MHRIKSEKWNSLTYKNGALELQSAGLKVKERRSQSSKLLNSKSSGSR